MAVRLRKYSIAESAAPVSGRDPPEAGSIAPKAWLQRHLAAIESSNAWVERNGLPLAREGIQQPPGGG